VPARRGPHDGMAIILGEASLALLVHYVNRIVTLPANERATLHKRGEILNFRRIAIIRRHSVATSPTAMNEFLVRTKVDSLRNQLYWVFHKWLNRTKTVKNIHVCSELCLRFAWDNLSLLLFYRQKSNQDLTKEYDFAISYIALLMKHLVLRLERTHYKGVSIYCTRQLRFI